MPEIVSNCPRCDAKRVTVDIKAAAFRGEDYGWAGKYEALAICRNCGQGVIYFIKQIEHGANAPMTYGSGSLSGLYQVQYHISAKDNFTGKIPDFLPEPLPLVFAEGTACNSIGCYNAAATMFRLCVDLATKPLLPPTEADNINSKQRRDLGLRLKWLFENAKLPAELGELAACIHQDGNDGAHTGKLTEEDAADVQDFAYSLLDRLFTEPARLELAKERRIQRRQPKD